MQEATLRELTRPLHHSAEQHEIGAAMADGSVSAERWGAWCAALLPIHAVMDISLPGCLHRTKELVQDLTALPVSFISPVALAYAKGLDTDAELMAAAYVFTGAHLMGGAVIEKRVKDRLPCAHLRWDNRRTSIDTWMPLRYRADLKEQADEAFASIIRIMDDIAERVPE